MYTNKLELQQPSGRSNSSKIKRKGNVKPKPNEEDLLNEYWSENYHQEIEQVKNVNFDLLEKKFQNHHYLPSIPHSRLHSLDHLVYLSMIKKKNNLSPFTKKQQSIFDRNRHLKVRTQWCFKFNLVIIIFTALIALLNFITFSGCDYAIDNSTDCLGSVAIVSIPTLFNLATILLLGVVSLYATGILPDQSSESSNKVQDKIRAIHEEYLTLAKYWIDVHFECPQKSQELVDRFDFEELKLRMKVKLGSKVNHYLTNPLEEAFNFIRTGSVLLTFTEIENYLYHKIMSRRLCGLEANLRLVASTTQVPIDDPINLVQSQENIPQSSLPNPLVKNNNENINENNNDNNNFSINNNDQSDNMNVNNDQIVNFNL